MRIFRYSLLGLAIGIIPCSAKDFPSYPEHQTSLIQVESLDGGLSASDVKARILIPFALDLIKEFEAWIADAYNDASQYCTIGFGHLIAKKACADVPKEVANFNPPLSQTDGSVLLEQDTKLARLAVQRLVQTSLNDEQFGALSSFVFNVGATNFETSKLLRYLNNAEYDPAAKQFSRWVVSKGKVLNGLIARRNCESQLFQGKIAYNNEGKFDRSVCEGIGATPSSEVLIDITIGEGK